MINVDLRFDDVRAAHESGRAERRDKEEVEEGER
jgi:hypothetical protein